MEQAHGVQASAATFGTLAARIPAIYHHTRGYTDVAFQHFSLDTNGLGQVNKADTSLRSQGTDKNKETKVTKGLSAVYLKTNGWRRGTGGMGLQSVLEVYID